MFTVMAGPAEGRVAAIRVFRRSAKDVDGRDKRGHDAEWTGSEGQMRSPCSRGEGRALLAAPGLRAPAGRRGIIRETRDLIASPGYRVYRAWRLCYSRRRSAPPAEDPA